MRTLTAVVLLALVACGAPSGPSEHGAYVACQQFVEQELDVDGYPPLREEMWDEIDDGMFAVDAHAETDAGDVPWYCVVERVDDGWRLEALDIYR